MRRLLAAAVPLVLASCGTPPQTARPLAPPRIEYKSNPTGTPGYVSPCAGGQPQMQYNCPQFQN